MPRKRQTAKTSSVPREFERCRRLLLAMRARLQGALSVSSDRAAITVAVEDEADMAEMCMEREMSGEISGLFRCTLAEIERAIEKLDNGTYGICEECGANIALERLRALPSAALCVPCKQLEEQEDRALGSSNTTRSAQAFPLLPDTDEGNQPPTERPARRLT